MTQNEFFKHADKLIDLIERADRVYKIVRQDESAWQKVQEHFKTSAADFDELMKKRGLK